MSTDYEINALDASGASLATEATQADIIRNKMSMENLVEGPTDAPETTSDLMLALPSTPKSTKQENPSPIVGTPDTVMTAPVSTKFSFRLYLSHYRESPLKP